MALGKLYAIGIGVDKDITKAILVFREAGLTDATIGPNPFWPFTVPHGEWSVGDVPLGLVVGGVLEVGLYPLWRPARRWPAVARTTRSTTAACVERPGQAAQPPGE